MNWKVQLCELNYDKNEARAVSKVLANEWLTMGERSREFENSFKKYIDHENNGVFVSSATAGLHLILMSMGVTTGDEVILPALTFVSDANVVRQLGAKPIFVDSTDELNFNVSERGIIEKISAKTRAIIIVHFAGFPMDLTQLVQISKSKNIPIIEDCAHAPGASISGSKCGNIGDFSFFSFFSNKNLAIGEGGMVFSKCSEANEKIRAMRSHGMSAPTLERHNGRAFSYDVNYVGLNYRADEIRAALGLEQLKKLTLANQKRKQLYYRYISNFSGSNVKVAFSDSLPDTQSAFHILPTMLPVNVNRRIVMEKMKFAGIQTSIHYPSFGSFQAYSNLLNREDVPVSEEICRRELTLPLHPRMDVNDVDLVCETLLGAMS
jgi:dTDP-4-amino-4,6-dideoxygalactose transaminase